MIYVDDARHRLGRLVMSHMASDTSTSELLDFAEQLGLQARWLQHAGQPHEHFDVSQEYRRQALRLGAKACTQRELVAALRRRAMAVPRWKMVVHDGL